MAVYVDDAIWKWAGRRWCHLLADDIDELHRFAAALGVHRHSYQGPPKTSAPHYDLTGFERDRAIRMGALAVGRAQILEVFRKVREPRRARAPAEVPKRRSSAAATLAFRAACLYMPPLFHTRT